MIFALLAYKVSKIQMDYVEYDPFNELGIDRVRMLYVYEPHREKTVFLRM